ncbi:MAG: type II toxin-antitoxin system prevent-host-death family antitoxin [Nitrospirae bacterium]|nr:type II toxin-antitoxin system prevent-host-death family antitoxin [Nitrospirota bacterium]
MPTTIRDLKDHLSELLRRVQRGEEIVVTSHSRPVARIVPVSPSDADRRLTKAGFLRDLEKLRDQLRPVVRGEALSETVVRMRRGERY